MRASVLAVLLLGGAAACKFPELPPVEGDDDGGIDATDADLRVPQPLTVSVVGDGTVTSDQPGIACPTDCDNDYDPLSMVTLTAAPAATSIFEGWSGDCTGTGDCTVTMDGAKNVTATFRTHGAVRWVKQIGASGDDFGYRVAVDPQGNTIVAGTADDGTWDLFVIKYSAVDGSTMWTKTFDTPDPNGESFGGLAVDDQGNVYMAARLQGDGSTISYEGVGAVSGDLFGNILVMRLAASNGAVEWVRKWGGTAQDIPRALAVSGANLYVIGTTSSDPSTFDTVVVSGNVSNGFIARASTSTGAAAQVKIITGSIDPYGLAVNGTHIAVVGGTRSSPTIAGDCGGTISGSGSDAMIIDLLGATLDCQWIKTYGDFTNGNDAVFQAVAGFPGGGWAVAGYFEGNLMGFMSSSLTSRGLFDAVAARLADNGDTTWAFRYGDTGTEFGRGIATTPEGNTILAGTFANTIALGAHTLNGANDAFVTRYSTGVTPIHEWAVALGGPDSDAGEDVAVAADGSVYMLSDFNGQSLVGGTALSSQGIDLWVAALVR